MVNGVRTARTTHSPTCVCKASAGCGSRLAAHTTRRHSGCNTAPEHHAARQAPKAYRNVCTLQALTVNVANFRPYLQLQDCNLHGIPLLHQPDEQQHDLAQGGASAKLPLRRLLHPPQVLQLPRQHLPVRGQLAGKRVDVAVERVRWRPCFLQTAQVAALVRCNFGSATLQHSSSWDSCQRLDAPRNSPGVQCLLCASPCNAMPNRIEPHCADGFNLQSGSRGAALARPLHSIASQ
jgi:hypothetical protein